MVHPVGKDLGLLELCSSRVVLWLADFWWWSALWLVGWLVERLATVTVVGKVVGSLVRLGELLSPGCP
jgi:hypothetical protein